MINRFLLEIQKEVRRYDILTCVIWPEIVQLIQTEAQNLNLFATGLADVFHRNFEATQKFLTKFEGYYNNVDEVIRFRNSNVYRQFMKRWNLSVYFRLRMKQIVEPLATLLNSTSLSTTQSIDVLLLVTTPTTNSTSSTTAASSSSSLSSASLSSSFRFVASLSLVNALFRCWTADVWLLPITHKFLKLSLQLLRAYHQFVNTLLKKSQTDASLLFSSSSSNGPTNSIQGNPSLTVLYYVIMLLSDVFAVHSSIASDFSQHLAQLELNPTVKQLVLDTLTVCVQNIVRDVTTQVKEQVITTICSLVIGVNPSSSSSTSVVHMSHTLQGVRTVFGTHLLSKTIPTTESSYIRAAMDPLIKWHDLATKLLPTSLVTEWILNICTSICREYFDLINLQFSAMQRTTSMLQKIKKTNLSSTSSLSVGENLNDTNKVALQQLYLDVSYFGKIMSQLGITLSAFEPWIKLWNSVKPAEKVCIPSS
jgi:hypothetical protein